MTPADQQWLLDKIQTGFDEMLGEAGKTAALGVAALEADPGEHPRPVPTRHWHGPNE